VSECGGTWVQSPLRCGSLGSSQNVANTTNTAANLGTYHTPTLPTSMHMVSCLLPYATNHDQLRLMPGPSCSPQIQTSAIWLRYYQFNLSIPFNPQLFFPRLVVMPELFRTVSSRFLRQVTGSVAHFLVGVKCNDLEDWRPFKNGVLLGLLDHLFA